MVCFTADSKLFVLYFLVFVINLSIFAEINFLKIQIEIEKSTCF